MEPTTNAVDTATRYQVSDWCAQRMEQTAREIASALKCKQYGYAAGLIDRLSRMSTIIVRAEA